ncbi:MAG: translocation protein TolB [Bacteroidota bacterium]
MHKSKNIVVLAVLLLLIACGNAIGQQARETFGKNRIQYKQFSWKFYSTDNFDVYFYEGGEDISRETAEFLEEEFDRITDLIGYPPYSKTKIFLYNSIADLQQSNVGVNDVNFRVGGQTKIVKNYVEVAHPGTLIDFKQELLLKVSELLINDMMFGGSLSDMFQNAYLLNLPEWFISGAAEYVAKGWTIEMDDYARELMNSKKVRKVTKFTGKDARLAGHSIWNFIAEKYGKSSVSNILNYTRIIRNEEKSIAVTLGISFKQVIYEWQNFYTDMDRYVKSDYVKPDKALKIEEKNKKGLVFNSVALSPNGSKLAYTQNDNGKYTVMIRYLESGDEEKVISGGYKVINQKVDFNNPIVNWANDSTLGVVSTKKGQNIFWLYDIKTKSKLVNSLDKFSQVRSFDFSDNGRLAVLSADVNGQNDLYLLSTRRNRTKRLTNDSYDDIDPVFFPNSNTILFSSNRVTDTLNADIGSFDDLDANNFNLFAYNLDTTENVVTRITNTISRDVKPLALNTNEIFYLSDQKGIYNVFKYNIRDKLYTQVSNYGLSIKDYDIDFLQGSISYVMLDGNNQFIYHDTNFDYNAQRFTKNTKRQDIIQVRYINERRRAKSLKEEELAAQQAIDEPVEEQPEEEENTDDDIINTDNYVFDEEAVKDKEDSDSFLSQYRKLRKKSSVVGPLDYETRFTADNFITSWVIDPLRGFGIQLETQMNDLLENHRFYGGIMATTDLRSGDIFAEYQYLKDRIDYNIRFDRNVIFQNFAVEVNSFTHRYTKNTIQFGASLPLSVKSRFTINPFYTFTRFEDLTFDGNISPTFRPTSGVQYGGIQSELIFDNSIVKDMNIIEGFRGKVTFKHLESVNEADLGFSEVSIDLRNYQKVHREITFATRLFYGKFFGSNPQTYLLGGMDNWLFNDENQSGDGNPLRLFDGDNSRLLFVEYVTSLRGFDYAELFGENVLLFNAELRIPIIKYLHGGPISSNFFRNLQFVGFYDIGSAWTGPSPFSEDNNVNAETISEGPFQIELKNFTSPWLSSYGFGLRTVLLGYYMKFDLAWPIEDLQVQSPRLHVTLGFDF